ncbi:response regulator transcription factor [candidate division KSB1 bacterium]|nr:response regulator transcription factor [candidate division KSB1 bacterium]
MSIKCLVVDDEPLAIDLLVSYIQRVPDLELVAVCSDAIQAFEVLQKERVDLLFLDIQMPKLTGMELVKSLSAPPKVVFTTAYRNYAVESYDLEVLDYLLKPITFERFLKAVQKYYRVNASEQNGNRNSQRESIFIRHDKKMVQVPFYSILFLESMKDYVYIHTRKQTFIVRQQLQCYEDDLPGDQFVRIHRSFIVAIAHIKAFTASEVEIGDRRLPIGRSYRQAFLAAVGVTE